MNSLNFKLVLNWPQLCAEFGTNFLAAAAGPNNYLPAHISTRLVCGRARPGQAFWARPIILITRTLCLLLLLLLPDSCLLRLQQQVQLERQLQRHLLFVFIKKILQRQHEINTEAKVHARTRHKAPGIRHTRTRTRSISVASCTHDAHTHTTPFVSRRCLSDGGDWLRLQAASRLSPSSVRPSVPLSHSVPLCRTCAMCRLSVAHKRKEFCFYGNLILSVSLSLSLCSQLVIVQMHSLKVSLELLLLLLLLSPSYFWLTTQAAQVGHALPDLCGGVASHRQSNGKWDRQRIGFSTRLTPVFRLLEEVLFAASGA